MKHTSHTEVGTSIHAGFPNAADDARLQSLDLNQLLIPQPHSTFHFRIRGDSWQRYGVFDHDIALVDRSLTPRPRDIVVWWRDDTDGFALSTQQRTPADATIWGVITTIIHQYRNHPTTP